MSKSIYCPKKCPYYDYEWLHYCRKYEKKLELGPQRTLNGGRFAKKCSECRNSKLEEMKDGSTTN